MAVQKSTGESTRNPSVRQTVNSEETRKIVLNEMFKKGFNPEYHQAMLRISTATQGLFWGSPPGTAI